MQAAARSASGGRTWGPQAAPEDRDGACPPKTKPFEPGEGEGAEAPPSGSRGRDRTPATPPGSATGHRAYAPSRADPPAAGHLHGFASPWGRGPARPPPHPPTVLAGGSPCWGRSRYRFPDPERRFLTLFMSSLICHYYAHVLFPPLQASAHPTDLTFNAVQTQPSLQFLSSRINESEVLSSSVARFEVFFFTPKAV